MRHNANGRTGLRWLLAALILVSARGFSQGPAPAPAGPQKLPLPDGPVILLVEDVPAFEKALQGGLRKMLTGQIPDGDPAATAWRRTRVGGKLETQWGMFGEDILLTWKEISALKPSAVGLSLLSPGDLEAVLVVRTALAQLPLKLGAGTVKNYKGIAYHVVTRGAGDEKTSDRRMGLTWARQDKHLLIATSERALLKALDKSLAADGYSNLTQGFAQLRLDLDVLRKDIYFKREFLFDEGKTGPEKGVLLAGLRLEGNSVVEVREGSGETRTPGATWPTSQRAVKAAGWESDGSRLWPALRKAILEPVMTPLDSPVPALMPIPSGGEAAEDRYLVDVTRPIAISGAAGGSGELPRWSQFLATISPRGWGWELSPDGYPRLVLNVTRAEEKGFLELVRATIVRRTGSAPQEEPGLFKVGPDLPAFCFKRTGDYLWLALRPEDLAAVPEVALSGNVVRWGFLDVSGASREKKLWAQAEGAFSSDTTRPLSDRVLGLLAWAPTLRTISVERKRQGDRFSERIVFTQAPPVPASPVQKAPPKGAPKKKA